MNWRSLFRSVELVVAFVPHSGSRNVQVAIKLTRGLDCPVRCIVALLREAYEHAFFVKSFRVKPTLKKG